MSADQGAKLAQLTQQMEALLGMYELVINVGGEQKGDVEKADCLKNILAAKGDVNKAAQPLADYHKLISMGDQLRAVADDEAIIRAFQLLLAPEAAAPAETKSGKRSAESGGGEKATPALSPLQARYAAYVRSGKGELQSSEKRELTGEDRLHVLLLVVNHVLQAQRQTIDTLDMSKDASSGIMQLVTKKIVFLQQMLGQIMTQVADPGMLRQSCQEYGSFLLSTKGHMHDTELNLRLIKECRSLCPST